MDFLRLLDWAWHVTNQAPRTLNWSEVLSLNFSRSFFSFKEFCPLTLSWSEVYLFANSSSLNQSFLLGEPNVWGGDNNNKYWGIDHWSWAPSNGLSPLDCFDDSTSIELQFKVNPTGKVNINFNLPCPDLTHRLLLIRKSKFNLSLIAKVWSHLESISTLIPPSIEFQLTASGSNSFVSFWLPWRCQRWSSGQWAVRSFKSKKAAKVCRDWKVQERQLAALHI